MRRLICALAVVLALLGACAPAAPSERDAGRGAAVPIAPPPDPGRGAANAPGSAGVLSADAAYRAEVVARAAAEGQVMATLQNAWSPAGLRLLEEAIEREYGVRIKISFTPVDNYPQRLATLVSELGANVTPSFDLYQTSDGTALRMLDEDAAETTNWAALLPSGTPSGVVQGDDRLVVVYTAFIGLMYDPQAIPEAEKPRSIKDLASPRWRDRFMTFSYTQSWFPYVVRLGREETLNALRATMRNGAIADIYAGQMTRFAAKERPMIMITSAHHQTALIRGLSAKFAPLDVAVNTQHFVAIPKRAAHTNAARLLAAVLAGPEGQRIAEEQLGLGNSYYATSAEARVAEEAQAAGFPRFTWADTPESIQLLRSPEGLELEREIRTILSGG
jgi:ABC-type Fe3+ transport system substrate-binding protein